MGTLASVWVSMTCLKTGVSDTLIRTKSPTPTSTMLKRNGTRQPQAANCSSDRTEANRRKAPLESKNPTGGPTWAKPE
jgi:hypothetical protein